MRKIAWFLASAVLLVMALMMGGCGDSGYYVQPIPNEFRGTWMIAAWDKDDNLVEVTMFTVNSFGRVHVNSGEFIVTGHVVADGALNFKGNPPGGKAEATGTMLTNDTGSGTWTETSNGAPVNNGTFVIWRANGGAYAGTWHVSVTGDDVGAGMVTVDSNGVISGTIPVGGNNLTVSGVVTGTGLVVVSWSISGSSSIGSAAATGTASGSTATGTWVDNVGGSGNWTATKN